MLDEMFKVEAANMHDEIRGEENLKTRTGFVCSQEREQRWTRGIEHSQSPDSLELGKPLVFRSVSSATDCAMQS